MEYYCLKIEGNPVICNNMDESGGDYLKWNKPDREKQMPHGITYMWTLTKIQTHRNRE